MEEQSVSERRSCELIGMARSSYRYVRVAGTDDELVARLHKIAAVVDPTAGYRMAWAYLRQDGVRVNHKRVHRVWKEEGLTQPLKKGRKRAKGGSVPLTATHANHVVTYDFVHDRTEDGEPLRMLTIEDEYTREGLAVAVARSMPSPRVQEVLEEIFRDRGAPEYLRSDNGSELVAAKLVEWLSEQGVQTHHIDPGSPWQNAYGESFNAILRRECLNREVFHGILEARVKTEAWRQRYNNRRPHSSLGYRTPLQFRDGVQVPLLEHGRPSTHHRSRELEMQRRAKKQADLYLQVVQS